MAEMRSDGRGARNEKARTDLRVTSVRRNQSSVSTGKRKHRAWPLEAQRSRNKQSQDSMEVGWRERRAHVCCLGPGFG